MSRKEWRKPGQGVSLPLWLISRWLLGVPSSHNYRHDEPERTYAREDGSVLRNDASDYTKQGHDH